MADLAYVLRQLPRRDDPNLLAGDGLGDDAAVYRLTDDLALVQSVDFFTPVVDDPFTFGAVAAANSLSDIYAMGGTPLTALNIAGFPVDSLSRDILGDILRGGAAMCAFAGVTVAGGHTVDDQEPKFGLAVTGTVHPRRFVSGRRAQPGDLLVLTKPIGSGVVATALKRGAADPEHVRAATRWMLTLNRAAGEAMLAAGAHAESDVTGFGLVGHLAEMCRASGVSAVLRSGSVPLLPGALDYARRGFVPGGTSNNRAASEGIVTVDDGVDENVLTLLFDPQTSGGLLLSLAPDALGPFRSHLGAGSLAAVVGEVHQQPAAEVRISV